MKMAFLPLSLAVQSPPLTAALSLPSLRPSRRSTVKFTSSRPPLGVVCCNPWDFSFHFEEIEPPMLVDIFPEFEPMPLPLPPPMPADPPLQHVPDEEEEEYYEYEDDDDGDLIWEDFESY